MEKSIEAIEQSMLKLMHSDDLQILFTYTCRFRYQVKSSKLTPPLPAK